MEYKGTAPSAGSASGAQDKKTIFISEFSHEIRTTMNSIIGYTNLAQTHMGEPDKVREYHAKILSSSSQLLALLDDIPEVNENVIHDTGAELKPCLISDILRDLQTILQMQLRNKQLDFSMTVADVANETICCDRPHINQLLLNLMSGAIGYAPDGGAVSLTVNQVGGVSGGRSTYEFCIVSSAASVWGTRLDMSVARSLAEALDGTVELSVVEGGGTKCLVTLALNVPQENDEAENTRDLSGRRILLAEDDKFNREIAQELLEENGFVVETAGNGSTAVEMVKSSLPGYYDLVLMDIHMPLMDGCEATREIRAINNEDLASIPIIAMTADAFEEDRKSALEAGINAFLTKPINVGKLNAEISKLIL